MADERQARYEQALGECYCTRAGCNFSCEIATVCDELTIDVLKKTSMKDVDIAFREQETISGVLKSAHGEYCEMFKNNAAEMESNMNFIRRSVFRGAVVMQFLYGGTMIVFKIGKEAMLHEFQLDANGRITPENGDFVHKIITDPRCNFHILFTSSINILEAELKRIVFTKDYIEEYSKFLDLQLPQVELAHTNLVNKVKNEGRKDLEQTVKQHKFMLGTYQAWHRKNKNFLEATAQMIDFDLSKMQRMKDMHVLALFNWNDFSVIPDPLHPRNFESLLLKD